MLIWSPEQNFVADDKSVTAKLLSGTRDIGNYLFSTLESHLSTSVDGNRLSNGNNSFSEEQTKVLFERLNSMISSLVLDDAQSPMEEYSGVAPYSCKHKVAAKLQIPRCHFRFLILFFILMIGYLMTFLHTLVL